MDPIAATEAGDLHFDLSGEKLHGHFALVRRGSRDSKEEWLLLHKHDEHAVAGWDPEEHPRSVKSGRTNDDVKNAPAATCRYGELDPSDRRRVDRAGGPRREGHVGVRRRFAAAHQSRQGPVPGERPHRSAHQTRSSTSQRIMRAGDAAVSHRPSRQPAPVPGRDVEARVEVPTLCDLHTTRGWAPSHQADPTAKKGPTPAGHQGSVRY